MCDTKGARQCAGTAFTQAANLRSCVCAAGRNVRRRHPAPTASVVMRRWELSRLQDSHMLQHHRWHAQHNAYRALTHAPGGVVAGGERALVHHLGLQVIQGRVEHLRLFVEGRGGGREGELCCGDANKKTTTLCKKKKQPPLWGGRLERAELSGTHLACKGIEA